MADGSYLDYSGQMDSSVISQISNYGNRTGAETLGKYHMIVNLCPMPVAIFVVTFHPLYNWS